MKHFLPLLIFIVTWNEYALKLHYPMENWHIGGSTMTITVVASLNPDYYTVEVETNTVRLATQKDVDLFVGAISSDNKVGFLHQHLIPTDAFNIKVSEEKEK